MKPDSDKLRRFALTIGLVLITYSFAVQFDPSKTINPLGLPLTVFRPAFVPIGLILASIYSAARFLYYGYIVEKSPSQHRAELWSYLKRGSFDEETGTYIINVQRRDRAHDARRL